MQLPDALIKNHTLKKSSAQTRISNALKQVKNLKKGEAVLVDARDKDSIVSAARGVFLLVNALPLSFTPNVMDAALEVGSHYRGLCRLHSICKRMGGQHPLSV